MKQLEIITDQVLETQKIGRFLAEEIFKGQSKRKKSLVIGLEGQLGSGKTTFIQGLAKGLSIKEPITSPSFVILKKFPLAKGYFYHIDCYRLTKPKDLIDLDFEEIISQPENIIVIEWAEKVRKILPPDTCWIKFAHLGQNKRRITL